MSWEQVAPMPPSNGRDEIYQQEHTGKAVKTRFDIAPKLPFGPYVRRYKGCMQPTLPLGRIPSKLTALQLQNIIFGS
eukprot:scaffold227413_cov17-Tisochrysis_lutea.AAC.1